MWSTHIWALCMYLGVKRRYINTLPFLSFIWTDLTVLWIGFLSHWAHFTVLRFIFVYVLFCVWLYIACMCSTVTWWDGPGGIEAWSLGPLLPSVLSDTVGWVIWPVKPVPNMTYNVFSGTLNPTQSRGPELLYFARVVLDTRTVYSSRASVCLFVCLSIAAWPHYCTDPDVTWGNGRGGP